jgi:hypothetical protein
MGAELVVASLWGGFLVYWLVTRRPSAGDSIESFRYELLVLQRATPARVLPTSRPRSVPVPFDYPEFGLSPAQVLARPPAPVPSAPAASLSASLLAASRKYQRMEARRRRRDILSVLLGTVLVTLAVLLVTGSALALCSQLVADVVFAAYVYMLVKTSATSSNARELRARRARELRAREEAPSWAVGHEGYDRVVAGLARPELQAAPASPTYQHARPQRWQASYGDFESYAELALAR